MSRFEIPRSKQKKPTPKCMVCGKKAVGSYSVDMDIASLPFCAKHKSIVGGAMIWAILGIPDLSEKMIKDAKIKLVRKPLVKAKPLKARSKNTPLKGKRE